jgi:hypothetical protein
MIVKAMRTGGSVKNRARLRREIKRSHFHFMRSLSSRVATTTHLRHNLPRLQLFLGLGSEEPDACDDRWVKIRCLLALPIHVPVPSQQHKNESLQRRVR